MCRFRDGIRGIMGRKDEGKTCGFRIIKPGDIPNKKDAEDIRV